MMKNVYRNPDREPSFPCYGKRTARLLGTLAFIAVVHAAGAQNLRVTGKVIDEGSNPLPGVSVMVKGSTVGTTTGADGKYEISAQSDGVLQFLFIGYVDQEQEIRGRTVIDVRMREDAQQMEEVVVVGYGTMRKVDMTGTVSSVRGSELAQIPVATAAEAITGKLAGVQVVTTDGSPDAEIKIRVRGGGSITQDNSPLYIIDGFPVENGLSLVAPSDIERIDVLKDASSTAIYGARGANGVVIITTKGGKDQRTAINFDAYWGVRKVANEIDMMDPYDFVVSAYERTYFNSPDMDSKDMVNFVNRYGNFADFVSRYDSGSGRDWQDEMFRLALTQNYNLSINGGNKTTKYTVGLTRNIEEGALLGSSYNRTILNGKLDYQANEHLSVGFSTRYNHNTTYGGAVSTMNALMYRPTEGLGNLLDLDDFDEEYLTANGLINPVLLSEEMYRRKGIDNFNIMGEAAYKLKDFTFKVQGGIDSYRLKNESFNGPHVQKSRENGGPYASLSTVGTDKWINTNTVSYTKNNIGGKHNVSAVIGQEWSSASTKNFSITSYKFPEYITPEKALGQLSLGTNPQKPSTSESSYQLFSFFGRISYDYMGKYLFNASLRTDGSSNFSKDNRWGYFPSVGAAWRISEEKFMQKADWISNLKLRYSFGMAGNDRIGSLLWTTTWVTDATTQYGLNNVLNPALKPYTLANPNIKWETTVSNNIGIDIGLFSNRLNVSVDFYNNKTKDLLLDSDLPLNSGFRTQTRNIGSTRNRGVEFVVDGTILNTQDFTWTAGFNISFNKNKVLALTDQVNVMYKTTGITTSGPTNDYRVMVGEPVGQMYGYVYDGWYTADQFVDGSWNPSTKYWMLKNGVPYEKAFAPRPGDIRFRDMGGPLDSDRNPIITDEDKVVIGNANPKHFGGFNTSFRYKNLDLALFFNWSYGNDVYNAAKYNLYNGKSKETNLPAEMIGRYTYLDAKGGIITDLNRLEARNAEASFYAPYQGNFVLHSGLIEDGSFLRLNNLTIGYTFPERWMKKLRVRNFRVYATGYNLFCWTSYSGFDPEVDALRSTPLTPGVDYWGYPKTRSFIFGVNLTF